MAHQRFADQDGSGATGRQAEHVGAGVDAAFGNQQRFGVPGSGAGGQAGGEPLRGGEVRP